MEITQKKSKKIYIIITIIAVFVAALSYYIFAMNGSIFGWKFKKADDSSINLAPPTDEQTKAGQQVKQETIENNQGKPNSSDDTPDTTTSDTLSVGFSAVNQNDNKLQVRIMVQEVPSSGTCTLTLTNGSQTVTKTASVYPTAAISTCQGFDVPVSELSSGAWSVTVDVVSGTKNGRVTTSFQIN
jgi:flagellar basal body-associated protein FliL